MPDKIVLEDLDIYRLAMEIGDQVWEIVNKWEYFPKRTIGSQFTAAADSVAANIAEGYGRYFYKDRKQFCYYSRGSLIETKTWALKSTKRCLMTSAEYVELLEKLKKLHYKLNTYIKRLREATEKDTRKF